MDPLDGAQELFEKGFSAVRGAVSGVAVETQPFMRSFARLCSDGWQQGWHEANGGNLSYRMTAAEVAACRPFFREEPPSWNDLGTRVENLCGQFLAVTGAGCYLRNVQDDTARNAGIVEIGESGDTWRPVWGFAGGGRPTSELPSHVMAHGVRSDATGGACRVLYHAHPNNVIALTKVLPLTPRAMSRALWGATTECVMAFPRGVGVVPCMVPGGVEIARATCEQLATYDAVVWAQHGLFASGADFDSAFGLMHSVEKAADIYLKARLLNGGSDDFPNAISDDDLRAIARSLGLRLNEDLLA